MASKRKERKQSTITVQHSTTPGERAFQHPRHVAPADFVGFGEVEISRPHRFRNGKLVAVGGIPVKGQTTEADSDVFAEGSAGEIVSEHIDAGNEHIEGWQHHAMQMYFDGNDEAIACFD